MSYWLGLMSKRVFVILYMVQSLDSALLCSRGGQERADAKVDPDVPSCNYGPRILILLPGAGPPLDG